MGEQAAARHFFKKLFKKVLNTDLTGDESRGQASRVLMAGKPEGLKGLRRHRVPLCCTLKTEQETYFLPERYDKNEHQEAALFDKELLSINNEYYSLLFSKELLTALLARKRDRSFLYESP